MTASPPETPVAAWLVSIVEVDEAEKVRCMRPGCNHTVHKAVHVVREGEDWLVLGSTCFAKRYGGRAALGAPRYGSGGGGRKLTPEERELLTSNTQALIDRFKAEEVHEAVRLAAIRDAHAQAHLQAQQALQAEAARWAHVAPITPTPRRQTGGGTPVQMDSAFSVSNAPETIGKPMRRHAPWPWVKPRSSMNGFLQRNGQGWAKVEHQDGRTILMPWPALERWETVWPQEVGAPDMACAGYVISDVLSAVAYLGNHCAVGPGRGLWGEVEHFLKTR